MEKVVWSELEAVITSASFIFFSINKMPTTIITCRNKFSFLLSLVLQSLT